MISEEVGKILGMAMAYAVSALGLLLAYYNYRKRVVKADRVMSGTAWIVVFVVVVAIGFGVFTVRELTGRVAAREAIEQVPPAEAAVDAAEDEAVVPRGAAEPVAPERDGSRWPLIGILIPGAILLLATWMTAALHRHFATHGHGPESHDGAPPAGGTQES